jgi:hypothetical protein
MGQESCRSTVAPSGRESACAGALAHGIRRGRAN